jgi:hypothetical protein
MDGSEDVFSKIIEISGHKYLVPTVITINGRAVFNYDGKIKIPIPFEMTNMRFNKVLTEIYKRQSLASNSHQHHSLLLASNKLRYSKHGLQMKNAFIFAVNKYTHCQRLLVKYLK